MNSWINLEKDTPMAEQVAPVNPPRPSMLATPGTKFVMPKPLADEPTVTMTFPRKVSLQLDENAGLVHFDAGLQEVPTSLAGHPYLAQQGVKRYAKAAPGPGELDALAAQLRAAGYQVVAPGERATVEDEVRPRKRSKAHVGR
jgi:hypothetical protein